MRKIVVESGQHLVDIAVQELGSADIKTICDLNSLEYDEDIYPGQELILPDLDPSNRIQRYMKQRNILVNSHIDELDVEVLATNDDEIIGTNNNEALQI